MKSNKFAVAALLLWAVTIAGAAGWLLVRAAAPGAADNRTAIMLAPAERTLVLAEMREFLGAVQEILDGINRNEMDEVAGAAREAGTASADDLDPALMAKLPQGFRQMALSVHDDMQALAGAAEHRAPAAKLHAMLADTLRKCVACHATWQLKSAR